MHSFQLVCTLDHPIPTHPVLVVRMQFTSIIVEIAIEIKWCDRISQQRSPNKSKSMI